MVCSKMRAVQLSALVAVLMLGCGEEEAVEPTIERSRPVKLFAVDSAMDGVTRSFPARIEASREAALSFRVSGTVAEILVRESQPVDSGQLLARLDPTDLQLILDDRQATYDNADRNFRRGQELVGSGNISRTDFDRMEAEFRSAEAALDAARQNVDYTELRAPFSGRIAKRLVEDFEEVNAKQAVLSLQQVDALDVVIDIPESLLRQIRVRNDEIGIDNQRERIQRAWVAFEGVEGQTFPITLKEASTAADAQTQTFEVTYSMASPDSFVVLPGMTAEVTIEMTGIMTADARLMVPSSAVVADASLGSQVWVLDADSMRVTRRAVTIGEMSGDDIEILSGLYPGDEVVAVGAAYLAEGMLVTRMAQREQAAPRADDPL